MRRAAMSIDDSSTATASSPPEMFSPQFDCISCALVGSLVTRSVRERPAMDINDTNNDDTVATDSD